MSDTLAKLPPRRRRRSIGRRVPAWVRELLRDADVATEKYALEHGLSRSEARVFWCTYVRDGLGVPEPREGP